jgi:hypothetical protein
MNSGKRKYKNTQTLKLQAAANDALTHMTLAFNRLTDIQSGSVPDDIAKQLDALKKELIQAHDGLLLTLEEKA